MSDWDHNIRHAFLGDMVVWKEEGKRKYFGVVYKLDYDTWGTITCHIRWTPEKPKEYNEAYGLRQSNIHNQRSKFDVIKVKGERGGHKFKQTG